MQSHTPQSTSAKSKNGTLEISLDGFGVCLEDGTYLCIQWSVDFPYQQVTQWLAFFARLGVGPVEIADTLGIAPPGESSTVISLSALRNGLALLTRTS